MMHFLELYLVDNPLYLYPAAIGFYALNLLLYVYADRKRQELTAISYPPALSLRARLSRTLIGALVFLLPSLFLEGELRALLAGSFLVMQLASLASILSVLQATRALRLPGAVTGQITYSLSSQALLMAANLSSLAFFAFAAFALTGSPSFFGAALYLGATSLGYRRRARQYAARP
jgi:hypothetical protein